MTNLHFYFFYVCLLLAGILLLIATAMHRKKLNYARDVLSGLRPKEKADEQVSLRKKNKQQVELELLLISNHRLLKMLADLDANVRLKVLLTFSLFSVSLLFTPKLEPMKTAMMFFAIYVFVVLIPNIVTSIVLKQKIKRIMDDLPGFIDLVAVCVQTGMTINMALSRVATDFKQLNPDLTFVMLRIMRRAELTSLMSALDDLSVSLPTKEIRMFTTVLQQSLNFGSSIYGQLIQLSADIRELQLLRLEEKMGTLAAKMSIPLIVFIMFPIVILILAPGAMRVFPNVM